MWTAKHPEWKIEIEHDRMGMNEPMVVTVFVEDDDPDGRGALACLTPDQALAAAEALQKYAALALAGGGHR